MSRTGWWSLEVPESQRSAAIIHVDIHNHSQWIEREFAQGDARRARVVAALRAELPARLDVRLGIVYAFPLLHWAGDGGFFARINDFPPATELEELAGDLFRIFDTWNPAKDLLDLRAIAFVANDPVLTADPANWLNPTMNRILKDERSLGENGTLTLVGTRSDFGNGELASSFEPVPNSNAFRWRPPRRPME